MVVWAPLKVAEPTSVLVNKCLNDGIGSATGTSLARASRQPSSGYGHQLKSLSEGEILRDVPSDVLHYNLGDFIQILHPTLVNDRTRVFLEKCNVYSADSRKISEIILLRHSLHDGDFDRVCEAETVMEHLRFICDHIKEIGGNVRVLRDTLWMPCQEGKMYRGEELYHPDHDLKRYLYGEKREDREWMEFTMMMGVSVVPKVNHIAGRGREVSPELVSCLAVKDSGALEYINKQFTHYNAAEANVVTRHVNEHVRLRTTSNVYECISATYDHPKLEFFSPYLPCLNLEGYVLDRINNQLKRSNIPEDKRREVWNGYYILCEQFNHPCEDVYIDGSHLRLSKVIWDGTTTRQARGSLFKNGKLLHSSGEGEDHPEFSRLLHGTLNIVWSDLDARIFRPKEEIPPMLPVIQKIYRMLNDVSDDQGKSTLWILSHRCIFFSPRSWVDHVERKISLAVSATNLSLHDLGLLSEFPELLKLHNIPRISERNVSRPLPSTKPYESTSLTLRLRSSARFILKVSGRVLTKEEKERLEDIADRTRVEYSLGEGLTRRVRADHYVDGERGVLMIDKKRENSKIEDLARLLIPEIVGGEEGISFTDGILREFMEQEKMKERRPVIEVVHMEDQYTLLKEAGDLVITLPTRKNPSAPVKVDGTRDDGGRHIQKVKYRMDVTLRNLRLIQMNDSPDEYVHYSGEKEADMHTPSGGRHIQETDDLSNDTYVGYVREDDSNMQAEWMDYEGEDPVQMDDDTPSFKSYAGMRHRLKQLERLPHDDLYHSLSPSNEAAPPSTTVESAAPSDRGAALPQIESDFADLLGKMGECYAYRTLLQVCRGKSVEFDEYNWVSRYSTRFFPEKRRETCDDGLGYDLFIDDMEGVFNGKPSKFLFEVKGHVTDHVTAFRMSKNEWRRAETSLETSHEVHVIMGVVVHPVPKIAYTLVNVCGQDVTREADGWLISGFEKGGTRVEELMRGTREEEKGGASKKEEVHAEVKETRSEIPVEEKKERVQTKKEKPAKREQKFQAGKIEEAKEKMDPAQKKKKYGKKKVQSERKVVQGKK
ncbi:myomesin [Planoprotostelium fungivorum]|uniref:Myomesin n=1 Tax=Planoprotostelium fungivorum TaxID=1890364 RepID=A0A2P6NAC1_9EUKA|nr:myomesin [Planoprotostelium fungivorum]